MNKKEKRARVLNIFITFLKFGCFTFGGGWSIVAQIQHEYVEKQKWITDEELLNFTSVGRSIPGLMVGNTSVIFGYHTAGLLGAIAAVIGIFLPPVVIMYGVTSIYQLVQDNIYVGHIMMGVRASVVPIILCAVIKLGKSALKDFVSWIIAIVGIVLTLFTNISNVLIVVLGIILGVIIMEVKSRNDIH